MGGVNQRVAREYSEVWLAGAKLPPVVIFRDKAGKNWLCDGFHRIAGAALAGVDEVPAEVRQGSRRDALVYALSANTAHGLRRTNADKRLAVKRALEVFPRWSDRRIAEACGVSDPFVGKLRQLLTVSSSAEREGADGKVRRQPKKPAPLIPPGVTPSISELGQGLENLAAECAGPERAALRALLRLWLRKLDASAEVAA